MIFANTRSRPPARIERLALRLSQFDYEIVHIPGQTNVADYYSRHPIKPTRDEFLEELRISSQDERCIDFIPALQAPRSITVDEIREATKLDSEIQGILKVLNLKDGSRLLPKELSQFKPIFHELNATNDGILLRGQNIVIPASLRDKVSDVAHVGHQGIVKTKRLIRSRVWYPGIDAQIEKKVKMCQECQAMADKRSYEPLRPSEMPEGPWQEVSADFFGPMPDGQYWFVNHCDYSKWISVTRLRNVSFDVVEPVLIKLFSVMGRPAIYKTDNGAPFQSHDFKRFAQQYGFKHRKVTPYWPRANATAETVMKKLGKALKIAKLENKKPDTALDEFLTAYHDTPHSATGVAPNMLMFGYARTSGLPVLRSKQNGKNQMDCHRIAREHHKVNAQRMKELFDRQMKAKDCPIRVGDQVLFKRETVRKDVSPWDPDPFNVTLTKGSLITASRNYPKQQCITRNSSCFKLYRGPELEEGEQIEDPTDHAKAEPHSMTTNATAQQEAGEAATAPTQVEENSLKQNSGRGAGRPTASESAKIYAERQAKLDARLAANPPTRVSSRLKGLPASTIASFEKGGRCCVASNGKITMLRLTHMMLIYTRI